MDKVWIREFKGKTPTEYITPENNWKTAIKSFLVQYFEPDEKIRSTKFYYNMDIMGKPVILRAWPDRKDPDILRIIDTSWCRYDAEIYGFLERLAYYHALNHAAGLIGRNELTFEKKIIDETKFKGMKWAEVGDIIHPYNFGVSPEKKEIIDKELRLVKGPYLWPFGYEISKEKKEGEAIKKSISRHEEKVNKEKGVYRIRKFYEKYSRILSGAI